MLWPPAHSVSDIPRARGWRGACMELSMVSPEFRHRPQAPTSPRALDYS
jgi:hypothetical protein